jgi:hypothetical protein
MYLRLRVDTVQFVPRPDFRWADDRLSWMNVAFSAWWVRIFGSMNVEVRYSVSRPFEFAVNAIFVPDECFTATIATHFLSKTTFANLEARKFQAGKYG